MPSAEVAVAVAGSLLREAEQAMRMNDEAIVIYKDGRIAEALAKYEFARDLYPFYSSIHYNIGLALEDLGRAKDAHAAYFHALELDPWDEDAKASYVRLSPFAPKIRATAERPASESAQEARVREMVEAAGATARRTLVPRARTYVAPGGEHMELHPGERLDVFRKMEPGMDEERPRTCGRDPMKRDCSCCWPEPATPPTKEPTP